MPRAFAPPAIEVWLPAALPPGLLRQRDARFVSGVARLKSGVTLAQAQSEVRRAAQRLGEQFPQTDKDWTIVLEDYRASRTGSSVGQLSLLYGAVADFFHFHWQDWSFYVFNIADMAITAGVLLLILDVLGIGRKARS